MRQDEYFKSPTMASAAFVTEFRSFMTFDNSAPPTQFPNLKQFSNRMAPQEIPVLLDSKDLINEPQVLKNPESPVSSPGTSGSSLGSSPGQPGSEEIVDIHPMMLHHSSSDDSDCAEECSEDPLKQMEGVLEKNGILAQNLSSHNGMNDVDMDDDSLLGTHETYDLNDSRSAIPVCHFCQYAAETRDEYNKHIHTHFQFKCTQCSYMARTKGRLENHMKNHREAPDSWGPYSPPKGIENRSSSEDARMSKKDRSTRCKTCGFLGKSKSEYYEHLRKKICFTGPLLECEFELCEFCTRYKHHFEYHLRNHYGSKPFKCDQCNYVCVNQSMLNSHMKSHSSQYPYRCKTCTYATKYLHSLKMHVKKYDHEPDKVLNPDGTVNHNLIIDVNGRRRGPKSKRSKSSNNAVSRVASAGNVTLPPQHSHTSPSSKNYHQNPALPPLNPSFMYNSPMFNNVAGAGFLQPPIFDPSMGFMFPHLWNMGNLRCNYPRCDYIAESTDSLQQHLATHVDNRQFLYERNADAFARDRHVTHKGPQELEARFRTMVGNPPRAQITENIPRTQAINHYQPRSAESVEATHVSGTFKLPENSIGENGVKRGFSPPANNGDTTPLSYANRHFEEARNLSPKDFAKSQESFNTTVPVQSSRSSSLSPPMEQARGSSSSNSSFEAADNCSSPLDLTRNITVTKSIVTKPQSIATDYAPKKESTELASAQAQKTKNRRKGKAFKIDQYMQYEEQPTEYFNPLPDMLNHIPKDMSKATEPKVKMEVEDLSTFSPPSNLPKMNIHKPESYTKTPENRTQTESSPRNSSFYVPPQHSSTPRVSSPVAINGHQQRNGHYPQVSHSPSVNGYKSNNSEASISANFRNGHVNGTSSSPKQSNIDDQQQQELAEKHKCPHCDIGFGDFVMLVMHMTCHSMGNPFLCAKCGANCKNRIGFMDHMINYCKRR